MKKAVRFGVTLAVLAFPIVRAPAARAVDSRLKGVVTDSQGVPIEKAQITLKAGRSDVKVKTNDKGRYYRRGLQPGRYSLLVEAEGYVSQSIEDLVVQAGSERELNIKLTTVEERERQARARKGGEAYASGAEAFEQQDYEKVVETMSRLVEEKPDDLSVRLMLAESLYELGRAAEAVPHYQAALELDPERGDVYQRLGQSLLKSDRKEEAMAVFSTSEEKSDDPSVSYNVGKLLLEDGRSDEAMAAFERALVKRPGFPPALKGLGNAYLAKQRFPEAKAKFEQYLAADPDGSDVAEVQVLIRELEKLAGS